MVLSHSVERLCAGAAAHMARSGEHVQRCILDACYSSTRYPGGRPDGIPSGGYTQEAAQRAVDLAGEAVAFVAALVE